jgi:hypothetical protein
MMTTIDPLFPLSPENAAAQTPMPEGSDQHLTANAPLHEEVRAEPGRAPGAWLLPSMAAFCALLIVAGSAGTWGTLNIREGGVSIEIGSVRGTTGADGQTTLVLGLLVAAVMLLRTWRPGRWRVLAWAAPVTFVLATAIGAYDWLHISRIASTPFLPETEFAVDAGWGLMLLTVAATAGTMLALIAAVTRPKAKRAPLASAAIALPPASSSDEANVAESPVA